MLTNTERTRPNRTFPQAANPVAALDPSESRTLSYVSPSDGWSTRTLIRTVEYLAGTRQLERLYKQLHSEERLGQQVWGRALQLLDVGVDFDRESLEQIPVDGPVVFVANHPYGVLDGLIMCHLISQVRDDFFLLVNESVLPQPLVANHLLPIDFHETKEALRTNLKTKRTTTQRLKAGHCLAIFPSGMVATASRPFGPVVEQPWKSFVSRRIHETKSTVVPIYFHGSNSRLFQLASHCSTSIRLGLLMHEVRNKIGKRIRVEVGEPIPYASLASIRHAGELVEHLRSETLSLANEQLRQQRRDKPFARLRRLKTKILNQSNTDLSVSP